MTDKNNLFRAIKGIRHVVINAKHGGFDLSQEAIDRYNELTGQKIIYSSDIPRDDRYLVHVVKELGNRASGTYTTLKIVEIPAEVDWIVQDYDGAEWIAERHRTWG